MSSSNKHGHFNLAISDDGTRWLTAKAGGQCDHFGLDYLALGLACGALHDALSLLGAGPKLGPARVVIQIPLADFLAIRDRLTAESPAGKSLFTKPGRKRVDVDARRFMYRGILFVVADTGAENFSCPMRGNR